MKIGSGERKGEREKEGTVERISWGIGKKERGSEWEREWMRERQTEREKCRLKKIKIENCKHFLK
jgi:hypothetical protein